MHYRKADYLLQKRKLIRGIELNDIKEVGAISSKVKNSSFNCYESYTSFLLNERSFIIEHYILRIEHIACKHEPLEIIKELISYVKNDNHTLKQLFLNKTCIESALHVAAEKGYSNDIKLLLETAPDLSIIELIVVLLKKAKSQCS